MHVCVKWVLWFPFSQRVSKVRGVKLRKLLISANGVLLSNDGGKALVRFECLAVNAVITLSVSSCLLLRMCLVLLRLREAVGYANVGCIRGVIVEA